MDILLYISEYISDIGVAPAIIGILTMFILIGGLKIFQVSRNTVRNSQNPFLSRSGAIYEPAEDADSSMKVTQDTRESGREPSVLAGENPEDHLSLSDIQEDQTVHYEPSVQEPAMPETENEIFPFSRDPELENFQLFTNPKHIFSGALKEIFQKKLKIVLHNMPLYKLTRFPFFKVEEGKIKRFYLDEKPELVIEELFELWRMGYQNEQLPILFIHYFFSINSPQSVQLLKSILQHDILTRDEVDNLLFLYNDQPGMPESVDINNYRAADATNGYDSYIISDFIAKNKIRLNRALWKKWENEFFHLVNEDQKGRFYLFFFQTLLPNTSFILKYQLLNKYKHILSREWREFIERQGFFHGHYEKLNRLAFLPPEYSSLITKSPVATKRELNDLLHLIAARDFADLHRFLVLYINHIKEVAQFTLKDDRIQSLLTRLKNPPSSPEYLPQAIRFLLFLYFYNRSDLNHMSILTPHIKGTIGRFIPRFYQLRLIFENGEYQRAYEGIKEIWNNDEENMLLMNETAIYAYHAGKIEEAEEIFSRMRELYPRNSQILHNESVFLKHKSKMLRENPKRTDLIPFQGRTAV